MSFVTVNGADWEEGLGGHGVRGGHGRGGMHGLGATPASALTAIERTESLVYQRLSANGRRILGTKPLARLIQIFQPQMDLVRDAVNFALDYMGAAANTVRVGGLLKMNEFRPEQPGDSRLDPAIRTFVQNLRGAFVFGHMYYNTALNAPLAMGLARALVKRGRWSQARLNDIAGKVVGLVQQLPPLPGLPPLPAPPRPSAPPAPSRPSWMHGLGEGEDAAAAVAGKELQGATTDAKVGEQAAAGSEVAKDPESGKAIAELLKVLMSIGIPAATQVIQSAVSQPPRLPDAPAPATPAGQAYDAGKASSSESGSGGMLVPLLAAGAAAAAFFVFKRKRG